MLTQFPIIEVPLDAPEETEAMGTKEKFWFRDQEQRPCLYKKTRKNTGEDWSEKISAELCQLLSLPHADYELATFEQKPGIISPCFIPSNGQLFPGNEILAQLLSDYPKDSKNPSHHTIKNIVQVIQDSSVNLPFNWKPIKHILSPMDVFIGYLLLDAWIGNTDRHHENWAFIRIIDQTYLAPTYDHASSLGRNESDDQRKKRLNTKDSGFSIEAYVKKCQSCLYAEVGDLKSLKTFDAFRQAAQYNPNAANRWLDHLANISTSDTLNLFYSIPQERISEVAIEFAQEILKINQNRLLQLRDELK